MGQGSKESELEKQLRETLDKFDDYSKELKNVVKDKYERAKEKGKQFTNSYDSSENMNKARGTLKKINNRIKKNVENAQLKSKYDDITNLFKKIGFKIKDLSNWLLGFSPYLIPATIILQTAIWVSYLSEGTLSNEIVKFSIDEMGEMSKLIWTVLTIFGAIIAYLLILKFDSSEILLQPVDNSNAFDLIVILLLISSILYILKSSKSLYYLSIAFIGSVVIRLIVNPYSDFQSRTLAVLLSFFLVGIYFAMSIPFIRYGHRDIKKEKIGVEFTDLNDIIDQKTAFASEDSYPMYHLPEIDWNMENTPIQPPRRPSRRSEYELYEWVGLLANLILWPTTLAISLLIGSGMEINGSSLNMDDNFTMLLGPGIMTCFFFFMQYKMDASARDGSLYAAQKQAYLDEMEKYVEARKAYLELVTLQAQLKKEQLKNGTEDFVKSENE